MPADSPATAHTMRDQAERCRRLARQVTDYRVAKALAELAEEFHRRAEELERCTEGKSR